MNIEDVVGRLAEPIGKCMRTALDDQALASDLSTLELWFERTRRYSFYL